MIVSDCPYSDPAGSRGSNIPHSSNEPWYYDIAHKNKGRTWGCGIQRSADHYSSSPVNYKWAIGQWQGWQTGSSQKWVGLGHDFGRNSAFLPTWHCSMWKIPSNNFDSWDNGVGPDSTSFNQKSCNHQENLLWNINIAQSFLNQEGLPVRFISIFNNYWVWFQQKANFQRRTMSKMVQTPAAKFKVSKNNIFSFGN